MNRILIVILVALMAGAVNASLLEVLGVDASIINSDELSKESCKSFHVINAYYDCEQVRKTLDKLKKYKKRASVKQEKVEEKEEVLSSLRSVFFDKVNYLESNYFSGADSGVLEKSLCIDCNLLEGIKLGDWDAIEKVNSQLFCSHESDYGFSKNEYCECVERRSQKLVPTSLANKEDMESFEQSWGANLGRRIFGGISATIYQIGNAVAENSILGKQFDVRQLPNCNVMKIRTFLERVATKGCSNGKTAGDVTSRLKMLFPGRFQDVDSFAKHFEELALANVSSGLPPKNDLDGQCQLPRQMQMQYGRVMSLGAVEEIYHSLKLFLKVIPEDVVMGIYHAEKNRPFDKLLEFALEGVEMGEIILPEGVTEEIWNQAIVYGLSMILQTGEGAKISNTIQNWKGLQSFIEGMDVLDKEITPPVWEQGDDSHLYSNESLNKDVLELIISEEMNSALNIELDKTCKNIFQDVLEKAVCEPLGSPPDMEYLKDLSDQERNERFLQSDELLCRDPVNDITDMLGFKSFYFSDQQNSVEEDLGQLYDVGMGVSYESFNQLCPILKTCKKDKDGNDICFFNKAGSIEEDVLATLSLEQQQLVRKLAEAEALHAKIKTRKSIDPFADELFADVTSKKINTEKVSEELITENVMSVRAIWEFGEDDVDVARKKSKVVSSKRSSIEENKYQSQFVNQFIHGLVPSVSFRKIKRTYEDSEMKERINKADIFGDEINYQKKKGDLYASLEALKDTYKTMEKKEQQAKQLFETVQDDQQHRDLKYERAVLAQERASLEKERGHIAEISKLSRENSESLMRKIKTEQQLSELQAGLARTQEMLAQQDWRHRKKVEQLSQALERQEDITQQKEDQMQQLEGRLINERAIEHSSSVPIPARSFSSGGTSSVKASDRKRKPNERVVAPTSANVAPSNNFAAAISSRVGESDIVVPDVSSTDYLSLERRERLMSSGISSDAPQFTLVTHDIEGEVLKIPMRAEFNSKGEIVKLVPELSPEHHAIINRIGNELVRQDLVAVIKGERLLPIISSNDFLAMNTGQIVDELGKSDQFNLHVKTKMDEDLLIPFKVLHRGTSRENIILNLVTSNYSWVKESLNAVTDKRVLEKIYFQMAREDQPSSGK